MNTFGQAQMWARPCSVGSDCVCVCVCRVLAMRTKEVRVGFQVVVFKLILKLLPTWLFKFKYNAIEYNRIINLVPQLHQPILSAQ